jgi:hypothetical protein
MTARFRPNHNLRIPRLSDLEREDHLEQGSSPEQYGKTVSAPRDFSESTSDATFRRSTSRLSLLGTSPVGFLWHPDLSSPFNAQPMPLEEARWDRRRRSTTGFERLKNGASVCLPAYPVRRDALGLPPPVLEAFVTSGRSQPVVAAWWRQSQRGS